MCTILNKIFLRKKIVLFLNENKSTFNDFELLKLDITIENFTKPLRNIIKMGNAN